MAKQVIIAAMEEVFGEYILNMSKENLKIAALRGKVKLDNVQLDGDLLGSHVLGAVGLHGSTFGILSCSVQKIHAHIPWNSLEQESTKLTFSDVHLVCVPLVPSTAHQLFGAGTKVDPQCTLRTRHKRLLLARWERNFWNGQMADQGGPQLKRITRAVQEIQQHMKKNAKQNHQQSAHNNSTTVSYNQPDPNNSEDWMFADEDAVPDLPRDWKVKFREKILRNLQASMHNVHIRCEVPQHALDSLDSSLAPSFAFGFTLESLVVRTANEEWQVGSHDTRNPADGSQMSSTKGHLGPNEYVVKNNKIGYFTKLSMYWDQEPPLLLSETKLLRGQNTKLTPEKWQARIAAAMQAMFQFQEPGQQIRQSLGDGPPMSPRLPIPTGDQRIPHCYICRDLQAEIRARTSDRTKPGPISASMDVLPFEWDFDLRPIQYRQYYALHAAMQKQMRLDTMVKRRPGESALTNPLAWWQYLVACVTNRPTSRPWADVKLICQYRRRYLALVRKKYSSRSSNSSTDGFHAGLNDQDSAELLAIEDLLPLEALQAFHLIALRQVHEEQKKKAPPPTSKPPPNATGGVGGSNTPGKKRGFFRSRASPRTHNGRRRGQKNQHPTHQQSHNHRNRRRTVTGSFSDYQASSEEETFFRGQKYGSYSPASDEDTFEEGDDTGRDDDDESKEHRLQRSKSAGRKQDSPDRKISLLQAMTIRLGNKVWLIDWRFHEASVGVTMVVDERRIASWQLRGKGNIRSFGKGKRDICFDITQCDVWHDNERILYVNANDDDQLTLLEENANPHTPARPYASTKRERPASVPTIPLLLREQGRHSSTPMGHPDLEVASRYLELPPEGVVCRIVVANHRSAQNISVSSHPATFVWTTSFLEGLQHFDKSHPDLPQQVRNAATPLARKAQLTLLSPGSHSIHLNVMAPKVWIPIPAPPGQPQHSGTLIFHAGVVRLKGTKIEGQADMTVNFRGDDFAANFVRHYGPSNTLWNFPDNTAVVQPFSITMEAQTKEDDESVQLPTLEETFLCRTGEGLLRRTSIHITPICLNLVDAELLARAMGKLYVRSLSRLTRRPHDRQVNTKQRTRSQNSSNETVLFSVDRARHMTLNVEKMELALEGHSKRSLSIDDSMNCDRSLASQDSLHESSPPVRTYVVEVSSISMSRTSHGLMAATRLAAQNASIIRLRDGTQYTPLKKKHEPVESQYHILVRADVRSPKPIFGVSLLHDGKHHLNEVEIDIDSVILRVTTTTLKDCTKAVRRIAEVAQVATREMERKVHEEGRKARKRDASHIVSRGAIDLDSPGSSEKQISVLDRPPSPTTSLFTDHSGQLSPRKASDSSILFRVTLNESTLLAGRPTSAILRAPPRGVNRDYRYKPSFTVIQVLSSALIMFQSVENPDGTGSKTIHVSIDNASALVNTDFERVPPSQAPPMIGPTGAEFRVVYSTENLGFVVSQDVSLDCETVKVCLTPNDFAIMLNISRSMVDRLRAMSIPDPEVADEQPPQQSRSVSSIFQYQKKGTGIATSIRLEVHSFSFVVLKAYKSYLGSPEFLEFQISDLKGRFEGCLSALSGECSYRMSVNFFNSNASDWDYAVEPVQVIVEVDQMPNELVMHMSTAQTLQVNMTSMLLRELAELKLEIPDHGSDLNLHTIGLRRATEPPSVKVENCTGFDIHVIPDSTAFSPESGLVPEGSTVAIANAKSLDLEEVGFCLRPASSAVTDVGERETIYDLPVRSNVAPRLCLLRSTMQAQSGSLPYVSKLQEEGALRGRNSPETVLTAEESLLPATLAMTAEPVVEFCMHNQRLKSSVSDLYSLQKGQDFLSSSLWSPADEDNGNEEISQFVDTADALDTSIDTSIESATGQGTSARTSISPRSPRSPQRSGTSASNRAKTNWYRPYLKNDSPEWTDMTCTLRMARERVMLPDSNWMWANDWTVDVSGKLGQDTDADGWEYQTDFEAFTRSRRDFRRGDICRRRRWTRTRIVRPPPLNDPRRLLRFVWQPSTDAQGNVRIVVRSPLRILNSTASALRFFLYSPSWPSDVSAGIAKPDHWLNVPVALASAIYMRIGKTNGGLGVSPSADDCPISEKIMILPTGPNASNFVRTSMDLGDVSGTVLHFLLEIRSRRGIVDIIVEPVLRVMNLLPCQIECQTGEVLRHGDARAVDSKPAAGWRSRQRLSQTETLSIESGKTASFTAVNPWRKPHIAVRVPGYKWSLWQRIVNRPYSSETWRPMEDEEHWFLKNESESSDEFKSIIHFQSFSKTGDPLIVIMSVEYGHCPTIMIYSQYWIVDQTGFGCRFAEGFEDIMGTSPDAETSRRSYLPFSDGRDSLIRQDFSIPGHQWSVGMNGMSLYFSRREKLALAIENEPVPGTNQPAPISTKWVAPLDISNVMPKTAISVDELGGTRSFELAISVTVCPGLFSRTKLIKILPRYKIINLLRRELAVAQDGCLQTSTIVPSQAAVAFHWEKGSLPPKIRMRMPVSGEKQGDEGWTNGRVRLDRVGITSMRIPTDNNLTKIPMVVQTEVRLATKEQTCAVVVVIWSANEKMHNPLYVLRNTTPYTVLCRQPLQEENGETDVPGVPVEGGLPMLECDATRVSTPAFNCGHEFGPMILAFLGLNRIEEFVWIVGSGEIMCFGFDDPEKPHILEWTCVNNDAPHFDDRCTKAFLEVDAMGSTSLLTMKGGQHIQCYIGAEHSTKVIEFAVVDSKTPMPLDGNSPAVPILDSLRSRGLQYQAMLKSEGVLNQSAEMGSEEEDEEAGFGLRLELPGINMSIIDDGSTSSHGREILLAQFDRFSAAFSQTREGYHEFEVRLLSFQLDNHVPKSVHPVLIFCPPVNDEEPLLHMSAVRRLQSHSNTFVFRYAAIRLLEVDIFLDRRTAETIALFLEPITTPRETHNEDSNNWVSKLTSDMKEGGDPFVGRFGSKNIEKTLHTANSGRIYFEQLHLHPVRLSLTFTQEWVDWNHSAESVMMFQFIRGMASIANAPLTFTSFVVSHVFEAPQALLRVIATHYMSQLTKQIFGILGSLAILTAPADFISNVGTGVRDFFYEPINGAVHGPRQFIEGLEAGTQSLARGVFVGVVRGAANVAELVNANLVGLTADEEFIDERRAHQRLLTDEMSRGTATRTFGDSLLLAGASVARSVKSGALGIVEQPTMYASKHGPVGFLKGVGKAIVGAVVKPVVGVGDAAVLVMNHMSDATSTKQVLPRIPKRLRRALPSRSKKRTHCIRLVPYDERAAKAQKIVTGGETNDDVYIGHLNTPNHLIIASQQCLWAIDRRSREPWCVNWEEISHFSRLESGVRVVVFSQTGLKSYTFHVASNNDVDELYDLLSIHSEKMGNSSELSSSILSTKPESLSRHVIPGVKGRQVNHIFGSCNVEKPRQENVKDEIDLVEQCFGRVKKMGSESPSFLKTLDEEAWALVISWGHLFSGLSSRRCLVTGVINGTGHAIQIKSTKLLEGGSPCYTIPTREFDPEQGILHAGGCVLFFGWGVVPNLLQAGDVFMNIETNGFLCNLASYKSRDTVAEAMPGYQVGFLEKSFDDSGWWAKYWLLVRRK